MGNVPIILVIPASGWPMPMAQTAQPFTVSPAMANAQQQAPSSVWPQGLQAGMPMQAQSPQAFQQSFPLLFMMFLTMLLQMMMSNLNRQAGASTGNWASPLAGSASPSTTADRSKDSDAENSHSENLRSENLHRGDGGESGAHDKPSASGGASSASSDPPPAQSGSSGHGSSRIVNFLKSKEGFRAMPYADAGHLAIGYGQQVSPEEAARYRAQGGISESEASQFVEGRVAEINKAIDKHIDKPLTQGQRDAITSLAYNVGTGWVAKADFTERINTGENPTKVIEEEFPRFHKTNGTANKDEFKEQLLRRRQDEITMAQEDKSEAAKS